MKMKGFSGIFVVVCLFCAVIAFPTSNVDDDDDAEIVVVPLEAQHGRRSDQRINIADGSPYFSFAPYNPFRWNFAFFDDFQNIVRQLRERVYNVWSDAPVDKSVPSVKTNSTSRVEYIDGRKVVINDTFYTKETDFGTSVYNVRVIDFLPVNDETTSTTNNDGRPEFDVESVDEEESDVTQSNNDDELDKGSPEELDINANNDNEIINGDIDDVDENFELDDDNNQQQQLQNHYEQQLQQHHEQQQQSALEEQSYTDNRLEEFMPNNSPSSSSSSSSTNEHSWESIENVNENINTNEPYPVDLSNDIAINQIAADQGVPYESDAEIFSLDEHEQYPISTTYEFVPVNIKK